MSLWIDVTDSANGNPITDAVFGVSAGNVSAFNEGNGWYYAQINQYTTFVCSAADNTYYSATSNAENYTSMSISLQKKPKSW